MQNVQRSDKRARPGFGEGAMGLAQLPRRPDGFRAHAPRNSVKSRGAHSEIAKIVTNHMGLGAGAIGHGLPGSEAALTRVSRPVSRRKVRLDFS